MKDFPRRNQLDRCTPAELAIYKAMEEVEKVGADVRLTTAIVKLQEAKDSVADFVDGIEPRKSGFLERLIDEKNEVDARSAKLEMFLRTDKAKEIQSGQLSLLNIQFQAMLTYSQCLLERLVLLQG
ncbi:MAG: hypothetical protein ABFD50_23695 [Smithella sp.]